MANTPHQGRHRWHRAQLPGDRHTAAQDIELSFHPLVEIVRGAREAVPEADDLAAVEADLMAATQALHELSG
jgi:hypothetical protein